MTTATVPEPVLLNRSTPEDFIKAVRDSGSHFFDEDTMRWFGTRRSSLEVFGGVVLVGCDSKAPEGYPKYWARIFWVYPNGFVSDEKIAQAATRKTVTKVARDYVASLAWSEATKPSDS